MNRVDLVLWTLLPYVSITVFVAGHVARYRRDQFGWTSRSTQLLEHRLLRWGNPLFHYGAFAAIGGHVLGLLVPSSLTARVGLSEDAYHLVSVTAGTIAGAAVVAGIALLAWRRLAVARVRVTTTMTDIAVFALLALVIGLGMAETVGVNLLGGGYDYRSTVAVWFRGVLTLDPHPALMHAAPLVYQLHATCAWLLVALWPFSRLVHAWSIPLTFLGRAQIVYRSAAEPRRRG